LKAEKSGSNGHVYVLAAAVLWGTTGTAQALAPGSAQPVAVGAVRLATGGLALLAFALFRGGLENRRRIPLIPAAVAGLCMAAYQPAFFAGVARTGVASGTLVAIGSAPVLAGLLGYAFRGERLSRSWAWATALAIAGCALLLAGSGDLRVDLGGFGLALCAGAAYATYSLSSKRLLEEVPPDAAMAIVFCLGALILSPLLLAADLGWMAQLRGLAVALHLGLFATALAYALFARGLATTPLGTAVTLSLAEPLTAGLLGVLLLREPLKPAALIGMLLVFSSLALLAVSSNAAPAGLAEPGR
jgi:DME family drug/metabolite transporter